MRVSRPEAGETRMLVFPRGKLESPADCRRPPGLAGRFVALFHGLKPVATESRINRCA